MKRLTLIAVATVAVGAYQFTQFHGRRLGRAGRRRPRGPDELLAERVRLAMTGATSVPVEVRCLRGVVTLRGTVRSKAERDLALAAALAVAGVAEVTNLLETEDAVLAVGTPQSGIASDVQP
ncbi:MAG TPA: BON domain-containing protein [Burkholderiales bacterium]|nr:BON domain-containing protein [Burkholderiales bacterium]